MTNLIVILSICFFIYSFVKYRSLFRWKNVSDHPFSESKISIKKHYTVDKPVLISSLKNYYDTVDKPVLISAPYYANSIASRKVVKNQRQIRKYKRQNPNQNRFK